MRSEATLCILPLILRRASNTFRINIFFRLKYASRKLPGQSIRLKGKGTPGYNGGTAGDLFLKVTVSEKPGFKRDGQDIFNTVTIPFITAVLGGDVTVPTIYGNVRCSIKPGTQSGSKLRLRGKGIVSMKNSSVHGDQYTTVEVQVPKNLSPKAKQKLREFAAEL